MVLLNTYYLLSYNVKDPVESKMKCIIILNVNFRQQNIPKNHGP